MIDKFVVPVFTEKRGEIAIKPSDMSSLCHSLQRFCVTEVIVSLPSVSNLVYLP